MPNVAGKQHLVNRGVLSSIFFYTGSVNTNALDSVLHEPFSCRNFEIGKVSVPVT
jgi:hypothetical protein